MRIDKKMNLVVPIYDEDGERVVAYVHAMPLPHEVVERYFLILGQTFAAIFSQGLGAAAGPGLSMSLLKKLAINAKVWEDDPETGEKGVKDGLIEEIRRMTNVVVPCESGWESVPLNIAVGRKILSEEDRREVESAIVFFTCVTATLSRAPRKEMLEVSTSLWSALLTSSNSTELAASLRTSTGTVSSGGKPAAAAPSSADAANATVDGKPSSVPR